MRADNVSRALRKRVPSRDGEGVSTPCKIRPALTDSKKVWHRNTYGPLVYGKSAACGTHGFQGRFAGDFETKKRGRRRWRRNRVVRTPSDRGFEKSAEAQPQGALGVREKCRMRHNRFFEGCRRPVTSGRRRGLFVVSGQAEGRPHSKSAPAIFAAGSDTIHEAKG